MIAGLPHQRPHAGAFAAQHQRGGSGQVHFGELLGAVRGERDGPDALLLQLLQRPGEVRHPRHRAMLQRPRGSLERRRSDSGGAVFRHHQAMSAERVRAAGQRAQVLRVGDAVEQH